MINHELVTYIRQQIVKKIGKEKIKNDLVAGGNWTSLDVEEAFSILTPVKKSIFHLTMIGVAIGAILGFFVGLFILKDCFTGSCGPEALSVPFPIIILGLFGGGIGLAWGSRWGRIIFLPIIITALLLMLLPLLVELSG